MFIVRFVVETEIFKGANIKWQFCQEKLVKEMIIWFTLY